MFSQCMCVFCVYLAVWRFFRFLSGHKMAPFVIHFYSLLLSPMYNEGFVKFFLSDSGFLVSCLLPSLCFYGINDDRSA